MALYLVQHGKNLSKDVDPDKGLSDQGIEEIDCMAAVARDHGVPVSAVKHSGKKRARQTAERFAEALEPENGVEALEGLGALDDVTRVQVKSDADVMLVGPLPFMERLTAHLVAGDPEKAPVFRFQNGGVVCLDRGPEKKKWFIKWALVPHIP